MTAHVCHARRCDARCKPTLLMCAKHWAMVPATLQRRVCATYRRGQCDDMRPSAEWHEAADAAIAAVALLEGCPFGKLRVPEARAILSLYPDAAGDAAAVVELKAKLAAYDARREKS